jgi:hypothetical protein
MHRLILSQWINKRETESQRLILFLIFNAISWILRHYVHPRHWRPSFR